MSSDHVGLGMSLDDLIKKQDKPSGKRGMDLGAIGGVQKPGGAKVEGRGRGSVGSILVNGRGRVGPGRGMGRGEQNWRETTGLTPMPLPVLMGHPIQPQPQPDPRQYLATIQKLQAAIAQKDLVISQQQTLITQLQQQLMPGGGTVPHGGGQRHMQPVIAVEEPIEEPDPVVWRGLTCEQAVETGDVEVAYR